MEAAKWDEDRWNAELNTLMAIARAHTRPEWKAPEVIVLRTVKDQLYTVDIPDFYDTHQRERIENAFIAMLEKRNDTEVYCCVSVINGKSIDIPSWNFRKLLLEINPKNENTELIVQGAGFQFLKKLKHTTPPKKTERNDLT